MFAPALALCLALTSCSTPTVRGQAPTPRSTKLPVTAQASVRGEALLQPRAVAAFFKARNDQPAWDLPADAIAIRDAVQGLAADGLDPANEHLLLLDTLLAERERGRTDALDNELQLLLTDAVAAAVDDVRYGRVRPKALNPAWNVDPRAGAPPLEDAIARVAAAPSRVEGLEREKIDHFIYRGLKGELARLDAVARAGGWPRVAAGRTLAPGARDARVPSLRARLRATGELAADALAPADSLVEERALIDALKQFQDRHRLDATGRLDAATVAALAIPVAERIAQVRANLERMRWVLPGLTGDFVLVNLPAFKAYLIRGNQKVWETKTQIGKEARQTPSFRSSLKFVIFNPTWTVPKTILAEDVLPQMRRGQNALRKKHLRVLDARGNEVNAASIHWAKVDADHFPYTLRQDAGADNALGRLKFMFPNPYDVYLHDTPHRDLFAADRRTFSSGCIRIEDPRGFAEQLLGDQGYDQARIAQTIAAGETKQVNLSTPMPVLIVYWTVSIGATGEVHYAPDVYGLDAPLLQALDGPAAVRSAAIADSTVRG